MVLVRSKTPGERPLLKGAIDYHASAPVSGQGQNALLRLPVDDVVGDLHEIWRKTRVHRDARLHRKSPAYLGNIATRGIGLAVSEGPRVALGPLWPVGNRARLVSRSRRRCSADTGNGIRERGATLPASWSVRCGRRNRHRPGEPSANRTV